MEEGNAFTGALAKAKDSGDDEFEVEGKKYQVKESIKLTEEEMIDLIERIVNEVKTEKRRQVTESLRQRESKRLSENRNRRR